VDDGEGSLGKLVNEEQLYNNMVRSTGRLDSILAKIDRGEGTAGALVNDAQLYEDVRNLMVRVQNLVADIEANPRKYFKFSVF
jgi:phospholipid/cholesterol/gamma-HCH transport system substrate-binding protein